MTWKPVFETKNNVEVTLDVGIRTPCGWVDGCSLGCTSCVAAEVETKMTYTEAEKWWKNHAIEEN